MDVLVVHIVITVNNYWFRNFNIMFKNDRNIVKWYYNNNLKLKERIKFSPLFF